MAAPTVRRDAAPRPSRGAFRVFSAPGCAGIRDAGSAAKLVLWTEQFTSEELNPLIEALPKEVALSYGAHNGGTVPIRDRASNLPWYADDTEEYSAHAVSARQVHGFYQDAFTDDWTVHSAEYLAAVQEEC